MEAVKIVLSVIDVIAAIILVLVVLFQSGKNAGLSGAIGGGSGDSFLSKNKAKSFDAKLARMTKWVAIAFMIITFILCVV